MGLMTDELNKQIREDKKNFGYTKDQFMHQSSEFKIFNYANAQIGIDEVGRMVVNKGIDSGKSIMIVGKPGSGKSTFGIQLIHSIMKKYDESTMILFDFEGSHTESRIKSITGMDDVYYNKHVVMKSVDIYTESVLKLVKQIAEFKKANEKELLIDNKEGVLDADGKPVKILPPTFIFIDSIAGMKTKDYQDGNEMNGLTSGGRSAINNKELYVRMTQPCLAANIIVVAINQVTQNMSMGNTPAQASTRYLKNTDAVGGGTGIQFMSNLWLNIEAGDKLEPDDKYGIKGFVAKITIVKSRNSEAGKVFKMVFNQREGYDEILSEFEYLNSNKIVCGQGVGLYLPGLETVKFRMSKIKEKYYSIPEFKARWDELIDEALLNSISVSSKIKFDEVNKEEPVSEITEAAVISEDN